MTDIAVHCRFFARYAEVLAREELDIRVPCGTTVRDAVAHVRQALPTGEHLPPNPMAAVNRAHVPGRHVLMDGDELAFLPPLAGG